MKRIRTVLTIAEETPERAYGRIVDADPVIEAFELRVDRLELGRINPAMFRRATTKPLIWTRRSSSGRSGSFDASELRRAFEAGFDLVDVEYGPHFDDAAFAEFRSRAILSFHDFEGVPDLPRLIAEMTATEAARVKIAVTPRTLLENEAILAIASNTGRENLTIFGMGEPGLYSRIAAPAFGSEMSFHASDDASVAAPGQLTVERAKSIFGAKMQIPQNPSAIFAVVGNRVANSLSPAIHNARFREANVDAIYTILQVASFDEIAEAMTSDRRLAPRGVSVTSPFKEDAYRFAEANGELSSSAKEARAVNTIVRTGTRLVADNTDVIGFEKALDTTRANDAIVIGAGGTARAAAVALGRKGIPVRIANRTRSKAEFLAREFGFDVLSFDSLRNAAADLIVNTLTAEATELIPQPLVSANTEVIDLSYASGPSALAAAARNTGARLFDGVTFLQAQALRQSELFIDAVREPSR